MRRLRLVPLIALVLTLALPLLVHAQGTKKVTGTLSSIGADSIAVKVGTTDMTFGIDDKLRVIAPGAGTRSRQDAAKGMKPKLDELLHAGDPVEVSYTESGGMHHASEIRKVASAGSAGVPSNTANGTVTEVSPTSLSIKGSGGGGSSFSQTYMIDSDTRVVGKGAGTAAAKAGGKLSITELVGNGDQVSVSYKAEGSSLHATEVRVTMKATK